MWILHFLPDSYLQSIIQFILVSGVILCLVSFLGKAILKYAFPPLAKYISLLQFLSIFLIVLGVFFEGSYATEMSWRARVEEMEKKVAEAEEKSKKLNTVVDTKVVTKTKVIREKGQLVRQYIDREVTKYDSQCVIPKEFVKAHNDSAEAPK
jgi:hypothetical protein